MTILVLSQIFPNQSQTGAGVYVWEQVRALHALGIKVTVVSPVPYAPGWLKFWPRVRKFSTIPQRTVIDGMTVEYPRIPVLPGGRLFYLSGFFYYLWVRALVGRYVREGGASLIHAHSVMPDGFAAVLLGREFRIPVVCTGHGSDVHSYPENHRLTRKATRWVLRKADKIVMVSEALRARAITISDQRPMTIVRNGADPTVFRRHHRSEARARLGLLPNQRIVLFVGTLREIKGIPYLLEAVSQLVDVQLCLIGDGELRQDLEHTAQRLGLAARCHFLGQRPHEELPFWYSAADCLCISSVMEGLPTILPEAMMCGTPVVATAVGGIPEVVKNGDTGLLVSPRDSKSLSQAIAAVLENADLKAALSSKAQFRAIRDLTWEGNARAMVALYKEMTEALCGKGDRVVPPGRVADSEASAPCLSPAPHPRHGGDARIPSGMIHRVP